MNYFTKDELKCSHCGKFEMDEDFMRRANHARHYARVPFIVNSAYRCPEHNEAVGGSPKSSHVKGMAMDVKVKTPWHAHQILRGLHEAGINRAFVYIKPSVKAEGSFMIFHIHFDSDGEKPQEVFGVRTY